MKYWLKIIVSLAVLPIFFAYSVPAYAQKIESTNNRVTVTPAKFELSGDPGTSITQALRITNEDSKPTIMAVSAESFTISGENGEVILSQDEKNPDDMYKWVLFSWQAMHFAPKESKILTFTINIPKEKAFGGHYASIIVSSDRLDKTNADPAGSSKVVSLVMLSISGNINDDARVKNFVALRQINKTYNFELTVKNNGNNHIKPRGTIVISNIFGRQIDEIPLNGENALPGVNRKMVTEWDPGRFLFGRYTATVVSNYGSTGHLTLSAVTSFWVISWPLLIAIVLFFLFISLFILRYKNPRRQ